MTILASCVGDIIQSVKARAPSSVNRPPGPQSHAWLYIINTPHSPGHLSRSQKCPAHAHSSPKFSYLYSTKPHHLSIPRAMMFQVSITCHQTHSTVLLPQLSAPRLTLSGSQGVCSLPQHRGSWSFLSRGPHPHCSGGRRPFSSTWQDSQRPFSCWNWLLFTPISLPPHRLANWTTIVALLLWSDFFFIISKGKYEQGTSHTDIPLPTI